MRTNLEGNENIIKKFSVNLQHGAETVGGNLYLTGERLIFEPHSFNIQTQTEIFQLKDISRMSKVWTKFLNLIPIFPNSLNIETASNQFKFVLWNRDELISQISKITSSSSVL